MNNYRVTYSNRWWADEQAKTMREAEELANKIAKGYGLTVESVKLVRS